MFDGDLDAAAILDGTPLAASFSVKPTSTPFVDERIAYADVDLVRCMETKPLHDIVRGYNRFDVFSLEVQRERPVRFAEVIRLAESAPAPFLSQLAEAG